MRRLCCFVVLLIGVCRASDSDGSDEVNAEIDGVEIHDETTLADALRQYGLDLTTADDRDTATGSTPPNKLRIRPRDLRRSKRLMNSALGYVLQYGYLEKVTQKTEEELDSGDTVIGGNKIKKAIKAAQRFHGLPATGEMDSDTISLMGKRRCGQKDAEYVPANRAKRYTLSRNKWGKHLLYYWFDPEKYTEDMSRVEVRSEFQRALQMWADVSHISFVEVETKEEADIKISFNYGDHGDKYPFYGPGGTLAHAFYPRKGLLHFDDAEEYTSFSHNGINLHFVAVHEMGHILGIKHADASLEGKAVMYPIYTGYTDDLQLGDDDIAAAIDALGEGSGTVSPIGGDVIVTDPPRPITTKDPSIPPECIERIDAAFKWDASTPYVYVFAGEWYYRLKEKDPDRRNLLPIYDTSSPPKRIGIDGFKGIPTNVDAMVESLDDPNVIYVFKDSNYYKYDIFTKKVKNGQLSDLWPQDTPAKIDGALKINSNTLGFLVGNMLYKYDRTDDEWIVGDYDSNYFNDLTGLQGLSLAFYRKWTWVFRDDYWYSVAKSTSGKVSSNYKYRLIKNDIKLPMCQEPAGELNAADLRKCKKELKKFKKRKGTYVPVKKCQDYVADNLGDDFEFDFDEDHFPE